MKPARPRRRRGGFTLVEVLLVLAILVILASLAVTAYGPIRQAAYRKAAKAKIDSLDTPLQLYFQDIGQYPSDDQGLDALLEPPGDLPDPTKYIVGGYITKPVGMDPWGRPYQYTCDGSLYEIRSAGPNGIENDEDDITNRTE